ncbi:MAG: ABC transporter ATP-binding protein [Pseudomonadota bacterium]
MSFDNVQTSTQAAVEVSDLRFRYREGAGLAINEFRLARTESCAVIGPSGCGKTTFVNLLAGLLTADSGSVRLLGQELSELSESAMDKYRGRHIGFVFQQFHLLRSLSVRENLNVALHLSRSDSPQNIEQLLDRLGLAGVGDRKPSALSYGQAQRVAIARALVHKPELVIADEPTSALDDDSAAESLSLLREVAEDSGSALLVVTHDHRVRGQLSRVFDMQNPQ